MGSVSPAAEREEKNLQANYQKAVAHLTSKCRIGKINFSINIGDDSKDIDDERREFGYPYFWVTSKDRKTVAVLPAKEYNELLFLKPTSPSLCEDTVAFSQPQGVIAIFARQNNRPFNDYLAVAFYEPMKNKVLAFERKLGVADKVEPTAEGFSFPIFDSPTDFTSFEVTVHGKKSQTSEEVFSYWNKAKLDKDKIVIAVDREQTWKRSGYQQYFKSQASFENAFGWDDKKGRYAFQWVYRIQSPDCIRVSATRFADSRDWICKTPQ